MPNPGLDQNGLDMSGLFLTTNTLVLGPILRIYGKHGGSTPDDSAGPWYISKRPAAKYVFTAGVNTARESAKKTWYFTGRDME